MVRLRLLFQCAMVLTSSWLWIGNPVYTTKAQPVDPCREDAFADLVTVIDEDFETEPDHIDLIQGWVLEDTANGGTLHVNAPPLEINTLTEVAGDIHLIEFRTRIVEGGFALHFGAEANRIHQFLSFGMDFLELYIIPEGADFKLAKQVPIIPRDWHSFRVIYSNHRRVQVCSEDRLVLDVEGAVSHGGEFVALGVGEYDDVYFDDVRVASVSGETGGSLCITASQRTLEPLGDFQLVNDRGEKDITSSDSLQIVAGTNIADDAEYRWYRNGVLIPGAAGSTLTNREMKTFLGLPEECTPKSNHTDHTITGYRYTAEVYVSSQLVGRVSTIIRGPYYSGEIRAATFLMGNRRLVNEQLIDETLGSLISETNANWVRIQRVFFQQGRFGGDGEILSTYDAETDLQTISDDLFAHAVRKAHSLGLKVFYVPGLIELGDGFRWTHRADPATAKFLDTYRNFIVEQADLAEQLGIDLFDIAPEMENIQRNDSYFKALVSLIRSRYSGKLTFQAIACCEGTIEALFNLNWIGQLDYIGLGILFEYEASGLDPTVSQLRAYYQKRIALARQLSVKFNKELMFTEAGVDSVDGGASGRKDADLSARADWQEQADVFDALLAVIAGETSWNAGIALITWQERADSQRFPGVASGFTSFGKFGGRVLASWYDPENADFALGKVVADADGDGVPDELDYCPNYPGSAAANGC